MAYESRKTKDREHWMQMKKAALRKRAEGERLTLEETAVAIWNPKTEKQPLTCMGVLSDVIEPKYREYGRPTAPDYGNL